MAKYSSTERIIGTSKLFQKGKIQVPSEVRSLLNLKDGDKIVWIIQDETNIYVKNALR